MQTPLSGIFKVVPLDGVEWGISLAIGVGALPVSIITRVLTRYVPWPDISGWRAQRRRHHGHGNSSSSNRVHASHEAGGAADDGARPAEAGLVELEAPRGTASLQS